MNKQIKKTLRTVFIFTLIFSWIFSGWPSIRQNPLFPPKIEKVLAVDTGVKTAGTATNTSWTSGWDTTSLGSNDTSIATYGSVGTATGTLSTFTFNVPAGATSIDGIKVEIEGRENHDLCNGYLNTYLSYNGGSNYTSAKRSPDAGELSTAFAVYTEGGVADTWGRTWSVSEFSDANFEVKIEGINAKAGKNIEIDYVWVTVYYTVPIITIANGASEPSSVTIAPGASITDLDNFTLQTSSGTDTVTAATVTLGPADAYNNIAQVDITNTSNVAQCTAVTNPSSNTVSFSTCTIPITTTETTFKVRITPKTHSNMPEVPGVSYATTGTVTSFTCTNTQSGSDTGSATITVDNASPSGAISTSGSAGNAQVTLNWTTSASSDFDDSIILRWAASTPGVEIPAEGDTYNIDDTIATATVACVRTSDAASTGVSGVDGAGTGGCSAVALTNDQAYSYKVFQKDSNGNYDAGATFTGSPFTPTAAATLTFSISQNAIDFGALNTSNPRFATTGGGSDSEVSAHDLKASTTSTNGYSITVKGDTLTSGVNTISAIGGTASDVSAGGGSEQFGIRLTASGGSGAAVAPYNDAANMYAYAATASAEDEIASSSGASTETTFDVYYAANIAAITEAGIYETTLTYICTGTF